MLSNINDWPEMSKAYVEFFNRENLPARSAFAGSGLALGAEVEIKCLINTNRTRVLAELSHKIEISKGIQYYNIE